MSKLLIILISLFIISCASGPVILNSFDNTNDKKCFLKDPMKKRDCPSDWNGFREIREVGE